MKKAIFTLIVWLCAAHLQAQQSTTVLQQIEAAGRSIHSMECILHNKMKRPNNEQIEKTGSLKYLANDKIAAHFPDNECIIIKGNRTKIKLGIFNGTYRNDRNPIFKPISRMLLYAISGQCQTLAEENNYNLALTEEPSSYTINLTTKKKKIIGYRQAVFKYSKDDKRLKSILLIDFKDNHNLFYFENQVFDKGIEESAFNL